MHFGKFSCLTIPEAVDLFAIFSCVQSCYPDEVHDFGASVSGTLGDFCLNTIFTAFLKHDMVLNHLDRERNARSLLEHFHFQLFFSPKHKGGFS